MPSKITRITQNPFGTSGPTGDFIAFGSKALNPSAPVFTQNPAIIQSLAPFSEGWAQAIIGSYEPTLEDMNGLFLLIFYQLGYILQMGIPEYDAGTTYFINSICQFNGVVYQSLVNNNLGNEPDINSSSWQMIDANAYGGTVASASSITLPNTGNCFKISGTTTINNITILPAGMTVELIFIGALTVNTGGNIILNNGSFATTASATLTLLSDGTNWYEISKSVSTLGIQAPTTGLVINAVYQAGPGGGTAVAEANVSGGAGVSIVIGPSNPPSAYSYSASGSTAGSGSEATVTAPVPANWYYEFTVSGTSLNLGHFFPMGV